MANFKNRTNPLDISRWHPRDVINARLKELGKTIYWLSCRAGSSEPVVYRYLSGEAETSTANLAQMLSAVGLEIRQSPDFDPEAPMPGSHRPRKAAPKRSGGKRL